MRCSGRTLVRQHGRGPARPRRAGQEADQAVPGSRRKQERERATTEVRAILAALPISAATDLVRAFATYFQLANGAEQVHRVRALRRGRADRGPPRRRRRRDRRDAGAEELAAAIGALAVQPVFTAHPTEASRRSVLLKLRAVADILAVRTPARISRPGNRQDRKLAEIIDLLWQTDELRQSRPTPVDEARNALFYLEAIVADTIPELTDDLAAGSGRTRRRTVTRGHTAPARQLDRRRPRRQPERDGGDHPRGAGTPAPERRSRSPSARSTT